MKGAVFFCGATREPRGPSEGTSVKDLGSVVPAWPWKIAAALAAACLFAVGDWLFVQETPAARTTHAIAVER
jgi:hypothetical protein